MITRQMPTKDSKALQDNVIETILGGKNSVQGPLLYK